MPDNPHPDSVVNPFHARALRKGVSVDGPVRERLQAAAEILQAQSDGDAPVDPAAAVQAVTEILAGLATGQRDGSVTVSDPEALEAAVEQFRRLAGHLLPGVRPDAE